MAWLVVGDLAGQVDAAGAARMCQEAAPQDRN